MTNERSAWETGAVPVARSGWTAPQGLAPTWAALEDDTEADVAIVGAGLAGASLCLHLAEAGVRTCLLEARQPGWGASGRNAGHVLPILRTVKPLETFPDGGKAFLEAFRAHRTIPYDLARQHAIDCDAVRSGYVNGMRSQHAFDAFLRANAYLKELGLQDLVPISAAEMKARTGSDGYPFGVLFPDGGRVNPYLLTNGMVRAAAGLGAQVHGDSEAQSLQPEGKRWRVRSARGSVLADRVVFCTNAYPTEVEPAFAHGFHPLTAYGIATKPLPAEARALIMPGGGTFSQAPLDINPLVRDRHDRLILSSIPRVGHAADEHWHFASQLRWLHRTWPATRGMRIEVDRYWTGRVALTKSQFPGFFELQPGVYGLMYFNAWGNVMAPLLGKLVAGALARGDLATLPLPVSRPEPVSSPRKYQLIIGRLLLPAARMAQRLGLI